MIIVSAKLVRLTLHWALLLALPTRPLLNPHHLLMKSVKSFSLGSRDGN